jgi:hypothetical protein
MMKLFLVCLATLAALSAAFAPAATNKASFALNAEVVDRKAFIAAAAFSVFGTAVTRPRFGKLVRPTLMPKRLAWLATRMLARS